MSKRLFGTYYYSMEDSYVTKAEAQRDAKRFRAEGYYARVARTGFPTGLLHYPTHKWAVYIRRKK